MRTTTKIPMTAGYEEILTAIRNFDGTGHPSEVATHETLLMNFFAAIGRAKFLRGVNPTQVRGILEFRTPVINPKEVPTRVLITRLRYFSRDQESETLSIHKDCGSGVLSPATHAKVDLVAPGLGATSVWESPNEV